MKKFAEFIQNTIVTVAALATIVFTFFGFAAAAGAFEEEE